MVPTILARSLKLTLSCGMGSLASEPMTSPSPDNGNGEELWVSCYHGAHNSRKVPLVWYGKPCLRTNDFSLSRQW